MRRRDFLFAAAGTVSALDVFAGINLEFARTFEKHLNRLENMTPEASAEDEDFWSWVRTNYNTSTNIINFNNGGVSPQPIIVQDALIKNHIFCNEAPSYHMWRILDTGREALRNKLADLCGTSPEELAINRNSTEGLNTVIFGLNLKAGDEVVLSKFDYPNMMNAWKQREKREGIKLVWIDIPQPSENVTEIVQRYESAITSRTRIVHITHMINWTGNLLPAKAIADMAHRKGCEVIVDAAHTLGHLDYKIPDTGADYLATSLHKWIGAPFGSGLLYIKKEKIKNIWALLSAVDPDGDDIKKFESLGTRSFPSEMAIGTAIDFHNGIGAQRKEKRLRYLKDYWAQKAKNMKGAKLYTSLKPEFSCALGNIGFDGWQAQQIETRLFEKYRIHSVSIIHEKVNGIRITPNLYTTVKELDLLVKGLEEISNTQAPALK
jgi:selenocysteine lyase/cysteine desulfurase